MNYDIIGDIHGHADKLEAMLEILGYRHMGGAWRQGGHMAVFVGDFIDRGPRQLDTLRIVHGMVEAGSAHAVMGNHEFNAIAWSLPDPDNPGEHMRRHVPDKQRQHQAFLDATASDLGERQAILDGFLELPLWLELPELRVVHACWHPQAMATLAPHLRPGQRLDLDTVHAASRRGTPLFDALETVLKGPEMNLPDGIGFEQGGQFRYEARTRWWDKNADTLRKSAIVDEVTRDRLPELTVPVSLRPGYEGDRPVFIGHYWMRGTPCPLTPRVACVDYSVGKGGPLVAYRSLGETELDPGHFVQTA